MDVDIAPSAPNGSAPPIKKFTPPLDPATQDTVPEAVVYLRLLLILANLDAGKVKEVSCLDPVHLHRAAADQDRPGSLPWRPLR